MEEAMLSSNLDSKKSERIAELELMLSEYKNTMKELSLELETMNASPTEIKESDSKLVGEYIQKIRTLEEKVTGLKTENELLKQEKESYEKELAYFDSKFEEVNYRNTRVNRDE
jgi:phage shock protein A